ncbi:retrovirus-related Pol polyprotein from transposon 297-like Protein [Elysia marginata]|uniref:Retrovirus-related Pol polyprotein from transposon 297-like Protein n=1 Tax=Elysia marginata TaxID=1093978 RepID=A0AAV4HR30_9GAST|nr:retrovirus-related Pol polyprotein from transposon 297-like Protein [Elysia marginata]
MHVSKCAISAKFRSSNSKEPMISHVIPDRPWPKLGADFFYFGGHDYLLVVDYFSQFTEIAKSPNKATSGVIPVLRPILARHGIPDKMIAENNPFNSFEMHKFARDWNFKITTSSPTRRLQDQVPTTPKLPRPRQVADVNYVLKRQNKHKFYYDRATRQHRTIQHNDDVRVQLGQTLERATVTATRQTPRSYEADTEDRTTPRRNQRLINPSYEPTTVIPADVIEDSITTMQNQSITSIGYGDNKSSSPAVEPTISPPQRSFADIRKIQQTKFSLKVAEK